MREFLKGLELDKETINTIMAEHGKLITESKEEIIALKDNIKTYEAKIKEIETATNNSNEFKKELEDLKKSIAEEKAQKESEAKELELNTQIKEVFGDNKFVNDYTEKSLMAEIKSALKDEVNKEKTAKDIFEELTKDQEGLFVNPNKVEIPATGDIDKKENKTDIPLIW